jgi:hypothetical protein
VTVTGTTGTTASLTWAAAPGASSYRIFVALASTGVFLPANPSTASGTSVVVTGLNLSTSYIFQVAAVDAFGNQSSPTSSAPASTTAVP